MASPNSRRYKSKEYSDLYSTPEIALDKLFEVVNFSKDKKYFEPCAGIGIVSEYLRKKSLYVVSNELFDHGYITEYNEDFLNTDVEFNYDTIISNPPYSLKAEVFERLFEIGKPFAMLVGVVGLFESQKRFTMFKNNDFEIMYFDKRISYFKSYADQKPSLNPPFSSVYVCKDLLPKQIVFEALAKK